MTFHPQQTSLIEAICEGYAEYEVSMKSGSEPGRVDQRENTALWAVEAKDRGVLSASGTNPLQ